MLSHTATFAETYSFLGLYSEAQVESSHNDINRLYLGPHSNCGNNYDQRLRRTFSDYLAQKVASVLA